MFKICDSTLIQGYLKICQIQKVTTNYKVVQKHILGTS